MLGRVPEKKEAKEEPKKWWNFAKKDPNAMDVDSMTTEQWADAMKKGLCFRCGKHRHLSRDCPEKKDKKKDKKKEETKKKWTSKDLQTHVRALFNTMEEEEKKKFKEDFA